MRRLVLPVLLLFLATGSVAEDAPVFFIERVEVRRGDTAVAPARYLQAGRALAEILAG